MAATETSDRPSEENTSNEKQTQFPEINTASARDDTTSAAAKRWVDALALVMFAYSL